MFEIFLVNIERRFLQALREQFNSIQEQLQNENELKTIKKHLQQSRREWRMERQTLINIIFKLKHILSVKNLFYF